MRIELVNTTNVLMMEIAEPKITQRMLSSTYGLAIISSYETDWPKVNHAIIKRWSPSGLQRVKTLAWKFVNGKQATK